MSRFLSNIVRRVSSLYYGTDVTTALRERIDSTADYLDMSKRRPVTQGVSAGHMPRKIKTKDTKEKDWVAEEKEEPKEEPKPKEEKEVKKEAVQEQEKPKEQQTDPIERPREEVLPEERGSVPFMITRQMKVDLLGRGYTPEDIRNMTPADAHEILNKKKQNK